MEINFWTALVVNEVQHLIARDTCFDKFTHSLIKKTDELELPYIYDYLTCISILRWLLVTSDPYGTDLAATAP